MESNNNNSNIASKVTAIVAKHVSNDIAVEEDTKLADVAADFIDRVEIIMRLEEEFGIEISDEEEERMVSIKDVVRFIENKQNKN